MKHQVYFGIAIRIIMLFSTGMLISFASPWLHEFLGDIPRTPGRNENGIDQLWEWSAAHYWYFWCMILLFLLSMVNLVMASINLIVKHYDIKLD
jgi:hypothetical protein